MSALERLLTWWRRPSKADRILRTLWLAEVMEGLPALPTRDIRERADMSEWGPGPYTTLARLVDEGLVERLAAPDLTVHTESGRPIQRFRYHLTPAGHARAARVPAWR